MQNRNELIAHAIYRMMKGYSLTLEQEALVNKWFQEEINLRTFKNLTDDKWMAQARKKYYAPGKEKGLEQLREALIADRPMVRVERRWLFFGLLVGTIVILLLWLGF